MFDPLVVATLAQRGQWPKLLTLLRQHADTEPEAAHTLGALLHGGSGSASVANDFKASATHYCCCVRRILTLAQSRGLRPAVAYPAIFGDAVHAIGSALEYEEVKEQEPEYAECEATLRLVARECGRSQLLQRADTGAGDAEAAVNALFSLGVAAAQRGDRDGAAHRYRQTISAFEKAGGAAVSSGRYLRGAVDGAVNNLRVLEAKTREDHALAMTMQRASLAAADPEHVESRLSSRVVQAGAVARPACAGCGATPLTLKLCTGSCGGAGAEGKFCGDACFRRSWKAHKKRTGCRNTAAGSSTPAANAAAGSAASDAGATRTFLYKASIEDQHGHDATFERAMDVDAAVFVAAAASDMAVMRQLLQQCNAEVKPAILALRPWRCFGCGAPQPTHLLSTVSSYLHLAPPEQPFLYDIMQPYCKAHGGACEAAGRRHMAELHAALSEQLPGFPKHTQMQ
jgi:hypothetical protein